MFHQFCKESREHVKKERGKDQLDNLEIFEVFSWNRGAIRQIGRLVGKLKNVKKAITDIFGKYENISHWLTDRGNC